MKIKNTNFYLILVLFVSIVAGCKNIGFLSRENGSTDTNGKRAPIAIKAKMVENLPVPEDAMILPEDESRREPRSEKRTIRLKSSAAVFDVLHFFRQEMERSGWRNDAGNFSRATELPRIPRAALEFENEREEVNVDIKRVGDDDSEINIIIHEKIDNKKPSTQIPVPMPSRADGRNIISNESGMTISASCAESLRSVAKFYEEMMPQSGWTLKNKTGNAASDETATMTYTKENQRAIITLVREGEETTSVNVRISD